MPPSTAAATERLYGLVANEEDARLCADIPDAACREVPGNFFRILASLVLTSVGDIASSLASSASASFWGWRADDSSRRVMIRAGALAAAACMATAALGWLFPDSPWLGWAVVSAYFVLGVAHASVRVGRKTYLVDMAGGNRRTDYVAVSNTAIGFALLAVGVLSGLAALVSVPTALALLGAMGVAGVVGATALREV